MKIKRILQFYLISGIVITVYYTQIILYFFKRYQRVQLLSRQDETSKNGRGLKTNTHDKRKPKTFKKGLT